LQSDAEQVAEVSDQHLRIVQKIETGEINRVLTTVFDLKRALMVPHVLVCCAAIYQLWRKIRFPSNREAAV